MSDELTLLSVAEQELEESRADGTEFPLSVAATLIQEVKNLRCVIERLEKENVLLDQSMLLAAAKVPQPEG